MRSDLVHDVNKLEKEISRLVEEFEKKHAPVQITIRTRWACPSQKYYKSIGGAAQVEVYADLPNRGEPQITEEAMLLSTHLILVED